MQDVRKIKDGLFYIGCSDRRLPLFESAYPIKDGISYNSYLINDDKTILFDTVDKACAAQFYENLKFALNGKDLDYIVVQHMEPDHCALLSEIVLKYPSAKIVCSNKTVGLIKQFFDFDVDTRIQLVKEGDTLKTQNHELHFVMAPMVHWPEVMVTYDSTDKILYSADAFGSFGAINGNLYDDEIDFDNYYLNEARRYYANIVGKYGLQVQMMLKKEANLDIKMICPMHGVIIKENVAKFTDKYDKWSTYIPEEKSVLIAYSSVYGNTENAANIVAADLADKGIKNIKMFDVSYTHPSFVLAEAFRCSHIVLATTTYNAGIFESMENFLRILVSHNLQNRKYVIIQNGSWAPACGGQIQEMLSGLKCSQVLEASLCIKSSLKSEQSEDIKNISDVIISSLKEE